MQNFWFVTRQVINLSSMLSNGHVFLNFASENLLQIKTNKQVGTPGVLLPGCKGLFFTSYAEYQLQKYQPIKVPTKKIATKKYQQKTNNQKK